MILFLVCCHTFTKKVESKFSYFTTYTYVFVKLLSVSSAAIIILTNVKFISVEELEGAN